MPIVSDPLQNRPHPGASYTFNRHAHLRVIATLIGIGALTAGLVVLSILLSATDVPPAPARTLRIP